MTQLIYVAGYPKSGTSWLAWLLGDILNCPVGGCSPGDDNNDFSEGENRPEPYMVRKGHFVLVEDESLVVPAPHQMAWRNLTDERVVFIVRDPRDIVVSAKFYRRGKNVKGTLEGILRRICKGELYGLPSWSEYVEPWLAEDFYTLIHYEELLEDTESEMKWLLEEWDLPTNRVAPAVRRQSFETRKQQTRGSEWHQRLMRKGVVGDRRNYFDREMEEMAWKCFGSTMTKLGYEKE